MSLELKYYNLNNLYKTSVSKIQTNILINKTNMDKIVFIDKKTENTKSHLH